MKKLVPIFKTVVLVTIITVAATWLNTCIVLAPEPLVYVEGFNVDEPIHGAGSYAAEWFGLEYTPTISYSLKKVELIAGRGTGNFIIQLRSDDGGWPSNTILAATSFTMVDTVGWQGAEFAASYAMTANTKYWIVFKPVPGSLPSVADSGTLITHVVGEYSWPEIVWYGKDSFYWMARFYADGVCGFDEYFYSLGYYPFDNDGDGFADAVMVEMDVDTSYSGTITVSVYAALMDSSWNLVDDDYTEWSITGESFELSYVELYVPPGSYEGSYYVALILRDECWNVEEEAGEFFTLYPPGMEPATAHVYIEHTYRGDLIVDIGVGDPASPDWSLRIWNGEGGSADNLDLTVDLSDAVAYLPPSETNRWFLKVYDRYSGDQGQIVEFTITYMGTTYESADVPVLINDLQTSYALIPSFAASAHIYIEHTYRGDLIVDIGVGDPASPDWSWRIWDRGGGSLDDLGLTVDLSWATAYLPPSSSLRWFVSVYDAAAGDQGRITEFTITYLGSTYTSDDVPVPVSDFETSYAYIPSLPSVEASAHIFIEHTYRGDLIVDLGVGDPASPDEWYWSQRIWNGAGGSADNLDLTVDLSDAIAYLPPSEADRWFLKVYDDAGGDQGRIVEFTITHMGTTYTSEDPPVPVNDFETSYAYIPSAPTVEAYAHIVIEHTYRGDLIVDLGVGDPASPDWSERIWSGEGGSADNLDLTIDLSAATAYLPPSDTDRWFLEVEDRAGGDQGQITEFTITYGGTTYVSEDPPVSVSDFETSYAFIPSPSVVEVSAHIVIEHTYIGDLRVMIGVDYDTSGTSEVVWDREGGSQDDLDLTVDLSGYEDLLPPSETYRWWLSVYDAAGGDQGRIMEFTITYMGTTYECTHVPVPINDFETSYAFIPSEAPPTAHIVIEHTYIGDLVVTLGVGDSSAPLWSEVVWNRQGGSANDLDLTVDLSEAVAYLPPSDTDRWFLEVEDRAGGDQGQITEFTITYGGTTYVSEDPPVSVSDFETSYAFIPSPPTMEAYAQVSIRHTYIGDLIVDLGVGDPASPDYSMRIWNGEGGSADNLDLTVDLSDLVGHVPPGTYTVWLKVYDRALGDQGQILVFTITYRARTYSSPDVPVPIRDLQTSYAYITVTIS